MSDPGREMTATQTEREHLRGPAGDDPNADMTFVERHSRDDGSHHLG